MAIEYVGGVAGSRAGSTSSTTQSLSGTLTGGIAASPSDGDLIVVSVVIGTAGRTPACAITNPAGYTNLGVLNGSDSFDTRFDVSYKVYDSGDGTNITIPSTGNTADAQAWTVQVFRGVDQTTPMDVAAVSATGTNTSRINPPSITPTTTGAFVVFMGGGACSTGVDYSISGDTDALRAIGTDTNDAVIMAAYVSPAWTSGAVDPAASTAGSNTTSDSWAAYTIALRPASGGGVVDELHELAEDWETGSIDTTDWPTVYDNGGTGPVVESGELVLRHDFDAATTFPFPDTGVYSRELPLPEGERVYCRFKPLQADDNGAGWAHQAFSYFAIMGESGTGAALNGFGFQTTPADGTAGTLVVKVFNNLDDEWWQDVATISSYSPNGTHAWLGLRHDASNFYFDTAPDDGNGAPGTWTQRASYSKSGTGVSFSNIATFFDACRIHFRTYHYNDGYSDSIVTQYPTIDGINSPLVGSVNHDATGAIVGGGGAVAGTATRNSTHVAIGAIEGGGAELTGTAAKNVDHDAAGAIVGGGAVLAGGAAKNSDHNATGAIVGGGAALDAAAMRVLAILHEATGNIFGGGAQLEASATWTENTSKTYFIKDSFEGSSLDAEWSVIEIGTPTGGVTVSGGNLNISQTNNTIGTGWMVRTTSTKDFESSQVYARLVSGLIASNNQDGAEADFGVHADVDSGYMWQQRSNGTLIPAWKVAGVHTDGPAFTYTGATHGWLRIHEEDGTVYWQHAPSSARNPPANHEWITDYTRTRAADGSFAINAMRIRFMSLMSFGTPGVPNGPVRFSCVNMRTDAVVNHNASGAIEGGGAVLEGLAARQVTHDASGAIAGAGATLEATAARSFEHTATGAIVGGGAIISADGSTSDITRKVWVDTQDTAGAWSDEPQTADPWTDVPPTSGSWGS